MQLKSKPPHGTATSSNFLQPHSEAFPPILFLRLILLFCYLLLHLPCSLTGSLRSQLWLSAPTKRLE